MQVAAQTNLSWQTAWLRDADVSRIAMWCTYHPGEVTLDRFLARIDELATLGVRHSVGVVGLREHFDAIGDLRSRLPASTYLWINAYKRESGYYSDDDIVYLTSVDRHFPLNNQRHASLGEHCFAGESAITVDGDGVARRCHFVPTPIGNIHDATFESALQPRACPNATCGCHIGYTHLAKLGMDRLFGDGLLARIPADWPTVA
jgi:hypothetical protein